MQVYKKYFDEALQLNYPENASLRCEEDYITFALAGLQLVRTWTIANEAEQCDFRFRKSN